MSEYDYREGMKIGASFRVLRPALATIRKADSVNRRRLWEVFPREVAEFSLRQAGWGNRIDDTDEEDTVEEGGKVFTMGGE